MAPWAKAWTYFGSRSVRSTKYKSIYVRGTSATKRVEDTYEVLRTYSVP